MATPPVTARRRAAQWHATLKEAGRVVPPVTSGDWTAESGLAAGRQLARHTELTAILAANDHMALGILRALHEAGRDVPGDVSVVGFDDVREASCFLPPLTTVHQDFEEVGRQCVALLLGQMHPGEVPSPAGSVSAIQPRLVRRASTGPPRVVAATRGSQTAIR